MHPQSDETDPERERLQAADARTAYWRRWGPYIADRQWGTVREDYSADGDAWTYFPFDHARSRAYRWGEDGIFGISDNHQRLCLAFAFWNGEDPFLKERFFGVNNHEGNHGEDVKEQYFYLDNTPTHASMRAVYKYPHHAFPYERLVEENGRRSRTDPEFELLDTGIFDDDAYFDIEVEYAKADVDDLVVRLTAINRGSNARTLHVLPTLWFRNEWSWRAHGARPIIMRAAPNATALLARHPTLGEFRLHGSDGAALLFTENDTNAERLYGVPNPSPYVKDGIDRTVVAGARGLVNPSETGTKAALHYTLDIPAGGRATIALRLCPGTPADPLAHVDALIAQRRSEADRFYYAITPYPVSDDVRAIQRQAFAGMLWSKQFYNYVVRDWLDGDPGLPAPPPKRAAGRNADWQHFYADSILSMPDTWEYPWFAAWDLAFHVIVLALVDPDFAKEQLVLLTREWFMHPNGELPAYEWSFGDVNPPVHAWAAYRLFRIERKATGRADYVFLERVFQKLLLNFTWWVNRKDASGNNVFQGGFLGLDNIGVFDREAQLPGGGHLNQADGTSWMGVYALSMLSIALELAQQNPVYEDIASKFFEHFLYIADAMNEIGGFEHGLWDEQDGFYYDVLYLRDNRKLPLRVRSLVGIIPLFAIEPLEPQTLRALPAFTRRMEWFAMNRPDLYANVAQTDAGGIGHRRLLAIADRDKLDRIFARLFDENEMLSRYGIRSLSKLYGAQPYEVAIDGAHFSIDYEPAESTVATFGGNSNWRGPIWFPINYLIIEALQRYHYYFGDGYRVEYPTGSGTFLTLWEIAEDLSRRLISLGAADEHGHRPVHGGIDRFARDPHWRDYALFYEYFHGDTGAGLGASHQTGWTGLVAKLIAQTAEYGEFGEHPLDPSAIRHGDIL